MGRRITEIIYYLLIAAALIIFVAPIVVAITDPGPRIENDHCYRVVAREGVFGYLAGQKHIEIACP